MPRLPTRHAAPLAIALAWATVTAADDAGVAAPARTPPDVARAIVADARALAAANQRYFDAAGRYATDPRELAGDFLPAIPAPDPTVAAGTYGFGAQHQVVLDLKADAYPVCRLLNRSTGFSYAAVPDGKPANSRDGCWKAGDGYRFEYLP